MEKLVIEVIKPGKMHNEFCVFTGSTIRIGRGFNNDVILDDAFVSSEHCEIIRDDEGIKIKDLNSKNGIYNIKAKQIQTDLAIHSGDKFIVGRTELRVYLSSHTVKPARPLIPRHKIITALRKPITAWILFSLLSALAYLTGVITTIENGKQGQIILTAVVITGIMIFWAGFWAIIGWISRHRLRFGIQLSIACLWYILYMLCSFIIDYAAFYFNRNLLYVILMGLCFTMITILGYLGHLHFATRMKTKTKIISATVITLIMLGLSGVIMNFYHESQYLQKEYSSSVNPPYLGNPPAHSIEEFIQKTNKIFE